MRKRVKGTPFEMLTTLATSVYDFAEWQKHGYGDDEVSRLMWDDVSDQIYEVIHRRPSDISSRPNSLGKTSGGVDASGCVGKVLPLDEEKSVLGG